ncbi:MauE/DoxX family redox-associated membrane protein [Snuella sedimenti]|uniref:Methylamine utilisation protein MauE domain-containing protein n=1 Tax=Snuella sedimenti TaxID=2798802 RepID=A0A8J7IP53_9FLAO|nr:MauE/DoxX family redox-associated membrane protein [Snuella sedimenti]MBJ6368337.1 hypothetical protein [Snuella sedimenti]
MKSFFKRDELFFVRLFAFLAFLIPFILLPKVWFSKRMFPMIPLFEGIPVPNFMVDLVLIVSFFAFFFVFVFKPYWRLGIPIVLIYIYWALLDQNRLQPFYFEIVFMVFALIEFRNNPALSKQCILLILVGTYFWSGLHKCNMAFFEIWGNGLNKRIPFVPLWARQSFTYAVPFLEASFGVFLIFTKTRKWGIWLITIMHAMILTTFTIGGYGYAVFPLTLFNVFTLFYLFYNKEFSINDLIRIRKPKAIILFLIAIVFPFFNFFGFYDHILGFSYFSAKPKYCRIHFAKTEKINDLPDHIRINVREFNEEYYIDLNEWAGRTIGVMVYPEDRVYQKIQEHVNSYLETSNSHLEYY